ncbi:HTH-type transcriptional regulatory protein GabR [compost metagenome]
MDFMLPLESYMERYQYKYAALYHALKDAIWEGRLEEGTRLPSSRWMAKHYGLSRGSVAEAYEMLQADGYVHTEIGSGTYVAFAAASVSGPTEEAPILLSPWARRVMSTDQPHRQQNEGMLCQSDQSDRPNDSNNLYNPDNPDNQCLSFSRLERSPETGVSQFSFGGVIHTSGTADSPGPSHISFVPRRMPEDHFPEAEWRRSLSAAAAANAVNRGVADAKGSLELREAIAAHLRLTRGIRALAERIILFNGSMHGIALLTQLLVQEQDEVVLEQLCYPGIRRVVEVCNGRIVAAELDRQGIIPDDWKARLLFVTPARQFPTGAVLSLQRRRELLSWASRTGAVIVEDDYDSEFRWGGRPIEPLKALDTEERVIYVGSFSKTMPEDFRVGFAVVPPSVVDPLLSAKRLYDPIPSGQLEQRAMAYFMTRGSYARHLRRLTRLYEARYAVFATWMKHYTDSLFDLEPTDAGLHVFGRWRQDPASYELFRQAAAARGVWMRDMKDYSLSPSVPAVSFGFSHLDEQQLKEGAHRMQLAWQDVLDLQERSEHQDLDRR